MRDRLEQCRQWIARLRRVAEGSPRALKFMEVCGTHTVNAFRSGLHSLMPRNVTLLSGPGCPVCVTSQGDVDAIVELAQRGKVTLCTYGDMIRVTGASSSLEMARAEGADIRVIYSTMDAVNLAAAERSRQVVLAAVGFETTAPATAAAVLEAERLGLTNFTILASHKRVLPAMKALLDSGRVNVDGFLCPGHVSVIVGAEAFAPIVEQYGLPCVVAGFEEYQMAEALAHLVVMTTQERPALVNCYCEAVQPEGNLTAQKLIDEVFEPADVTWRALGKLARSGLALRRRYALFDARVRYDVQTIEGEDPPGCRCGDVITGRCAPSECNLFGKFCTPVYPVGPCMVSSEGTCQAWFKYGRGSRLTQEALA